MWVGKWYDRGEESNTLLFAYNRCPIDLEMQPHNLYELRAVPTGRGYLQAMSGDYGNQRIIHNVQMPCRCKVCSWSGLFLFTSIKPAM